jgi:hypothetical protein
MAPAWFKGLRSLFRCKKANRGSLSKLKISEYLQTSDTIIVHTPTPDAAESAYVLEMMRQHANNTIYLLQSPPNIRSRTGAWKAASDYQSALVSPTGTSRFSSLKLAAVAVHCLLTYCVALTVCAADEGGHFSMSAKDDQVDDDLSKPNKVSGLFSSASSDVTCTSTQSNTSGKLADAATEDKTHNYKYNNIVTLLAIIASLIVSIEYKSECVLHKLVWFIKLYHVQRALQ